jgi:hypothetical protein
MVVVSITAQKAIKVDPHFKVGFFKSHRMTKKGQPEGRP